MENKELDVREGKINFFDNETKEITSSIPGWYLFVDGVQASPNIAYPSKEVAIEQITIMIEWQRKIERETWYGHSTDEEYRNRC